MKPPISDSNAPPLPVEKEDVEKFRVRFWPYATYTALMCLVLYLPFYGVFLLPIGISWLEILALSIASAALAFPLCAVAVRLCPIRVHTWGLRAFDFWLLPKQTGWDDITHVERIWLGFPYAVISTRHKKRAIWIPLLLCDTLGFTRAVARHAAPAHPLRRFFEELLASR